MTSVYDLTFIQQLCLTRLTILDAHKMTDENRLVQILRHIPALAHLRIQGNQEHPLAMATMPDLKLQDIANLVTSGILHKLESLNIDCWKFSLEARISDYRIKSVDLSESIASIPMISHP